MLRTRSRGGTSRTAAGLRVHAGWSVGTPAPLPLRILLAVSRPDNLDCIDPRHATRAMLDALAPLEDEVAVDFWRPATLGRMKHMLDIADQEGRPYHIVHFNGHGEAGGLRFEGGGLRGSRTQVEYVPVGALGETFAAHRVPVAILEACRSGAVGPAAAASRRA